MPDVPHTTTPAGGGGTPTARPPACRSVGPAALTAQDLAGALRPFGESTMLPAAAYVSDSILAWERRAFFAGSWVCLGRRAELGAAGTQRALTVGDIPVVLTFDRSTAHGTAAGSTMAGATAGDVAAAGGTSGDERVRAFANVCRHRAHHLLADGASSQRRVVVCPYHGWSYDLDGRVRTAPGMGESFDARDYGLVELPTVDWHGWVFVNATATARPFDAHLGRLDELVAPYRPERLVTRARHHYRVAANWKVIVENYHECYHCPLIHPELCRVSPPDSGENWHEPGAWVGGSMRLRSHAQTMSLDGTSRGVPLSGADPGTVRYLGVFPNLLVSLHPDYVLTHRLEPLAPDQTLVDCEWLFHEKVTDPSYAVDFWDLTNRQDWAACESVQRGIASPHFRPGPLAPKEGAVHDWVTMLARAYLGLDPVTSPHKVG